MYPMPVHTIPVTREFLAVLSDRLRCFLPLRVRALPGRELAERGSESFVRHTSGEGRLQQKPTFAGQPMNGVCWSRAAESATDASWDKTAVPDCHMDGRFSAEPTFCPCPAVSTSFNEQLLPTNGQRVATSPLVTNGEYRRKCVEQ